MTEASFVKPEPVRPRHASHADRFDPVMFQTVSYNLAIDVRSVCSCRTFIERICCWSFEKFFRTLGDVNFACGGGLPVSSVPGPTMYAVAFVDVQCAIVIGPPNRRIAHLVCLEALIQKDTAGNEVSRRRAYEKILKDSSRFFQLKDDKKHRSDVDCQIVMRTV